jgi:periplasmic copper chaperone A
MLSLVATLYAGNVNVENAYVREVPPNMPNSAAFMKISNSSDNDMSLVSASSDISKVVELHTHSLKDGMMQMHQVEKIDVASKSTTELKPMGLHVMFIGLNKKLVEGESVEFTLNFSNGESLKVTAPIKKVENTMCNNCNKGK